MKTINYIAKWAPDKKQTWSGTIWNIYCSLGKYYNVEDIDVSIVHAPLIYKIIRRIDTKIRTGLNDFGISRIKKVRKHIDDLGMNSGIFFQFEEAVLDSDLKQTYIFIDESVDHVLWMSKHQPGIFQKSNFIIQSKSSIRKRSSLQNDYFRQCAGIFTMNHWILDDLVNRTGIPAEKVHYAGGGINVDLDRIDDSRKEGNKILFVGKDFERKGGFHVVEAFKELLKTMPEAELYVAGPKTNPVKEEIPGYHFLGLCTRDQLNDLYNKCDVFAMPSYYEAFGIAFVEALTFGLPCLVRNNQEMPYIIDHGKTGYVIDKDDAEVSAAYLYEMLTDGSFRQNVVSKRPFYKDFYSWDAVAKRIQAVIQ